LFYLDQRRKRGRGHILYKPTLTRKHLSDREAANRPCGHQSRAATHCQKRILLIGTRILSFDDLPTPMCGNYEVISFTDTVSCSAQPAFDKTLNRKTRQKPTSKTVALL